MRLSIGSTASPWPPSAAFSDPNDSSVTISFVAPSSMSNDSPVWLTSVIKMWLVVGLTATLTGGWGSAMAIKSPSWSRTHNCGSAAS